MTQKVSERENTLVSVIMPAFNAEATIEASIESVLSQTYVYWELLVVDDASSDATAEIVKKYEKKEPRIKLFINSTNQGTAESRNIASRHAKGEWLAYLDSDDLWHPKKLELQMAFVENASTIEKSPDKLEHRMAFTKKPSMMGSTPAKGINNSNPIHNVCITYTATAYMDSLGKPYSYVLPAEQKLTYKNLLRRNIMTCSSVMVRKDCTLPFPSGFLHEDYAVWMQIVKKAGCAYGIDEPLTMYRISETSKSYSRLRSGIMNFNAYRFVGYGGLVALCLSLRYAVHSVGKRLRIRFQSNTRSKS